MRLPEVAEDHYESQYNAANSDRDQQGHVVDVSIYIIWRQRDEEMDRREVGVGGERVK